MLKIYLHMHWFYVIIPKAKENRMLKWIKTDTKKSPTSLSSQTSIELKRANSNVNFIHPGHPLYDNIASSEENKYRILAPNESAYDETSMIHNFAAIVTHNQQNFLVINTFKHFKEQSIGGLLQYDENIYSVIPFFENEEEYQTSNDYSFREIYEYDHPVEHYGFTYTDNINYGNIKLDKGKSPIHISMIDNNRNLFTDKMPQEMISLIDFIIIPAINAYNQIQENRKQKEA